VTEIDFVINEPISNDELNALRQAAWGGRQDADWTEAFKRAFGWVTARQDGRLVGFVRLLWDGDVHLFLLDTTVHPDLQRRGIGARLVHEAVAMARATNCEWLHVDYEPHLASFYAAAGFQPSHAGVIDLTAPAAS
jgi:GNAT superfamily N-acetyltransferase